MGNINWSWLGIIVSAIATFLISVLFLERGNEFTAEVIVLKDFDLYGQYYYVDINGDGRFDKARIVQTTGMSTAIIFYNDEGDLIDQYNFRGSRVPYSELNWLDLDIDGLKEGILFTFIGDSLFMNVFKPLQPADPYIASIYIDECRLLDGEPLYRITNCLSFDKTGDGIVEVYFGVSGGFILRPRNVYYVNIAGRSVNKSPEAGAGPRYSLEMGDINGDGRPEFWGPVSSPGNFKVPVQYSDTAAWFMIFNDDLQFLFEPIYFGPGLTRVFIHSIKSGDTSRLFGIYDYNGISDTIDSRIAEVDLNGRIVRSKNFSELGMGRLNNAFILDEEIWIANSNQTLSIFSTEIDLIKEVPTPLGILSKQVDLLGDGDPELVFYENTGRVTFTNLSFKELLVFEIEGNNIFLYGPEKVTGSDKGNGVYLKTTEKEYFVRIEPNKQRRFYFLYVVLIFIVNSVLVFILIYFTRRQERKWQEREKEMRSLQLHSLQNQVNPHFIFNALNSISAMYLRGDSEKADSFMTGFSRLIREVLVSSERTVVTLQEEVKFVTNYLELEKIRLGELFTYTVSLPKECRKIEVPSMAIHTFVENAIKHGIKDLSDEREINVNVVRQEGRIIISISDNGPGFGLSTSSRESTGKGLENITKIFKSYSEITGKQISWRLTEASGKKKSGGTTILITKEI